jgi:hypothetical protein
MQGEVQTETDGCLRLAKPLRDCESHGAKESGKPITLGGQQQKAVMGRVRCLVTECMEGSAG